MKNILVILVGAYLGVPDRILIPKDGVARRLRRVNSRSKSRRVPSHFHPRLDITGVIVGLFVELSDF